MKTYQIHLIRHGITDGNLKGQYIGRTDVPLAQEGIEQLEKYREKYSYPQADAYFISPMLRCRQTLEILYPGKTAIEIPDFRESNFGVWEEKTAKELEDDPEFITWMSGGGNDAPPCGESSIEFAQRVCESFEKVVDGMLKTGTRSAVIVAHGGTIMAILTMFGLPRAASHEWLVSSGMGYSVRIHPGLWSSGRVVEVYDTIPSMEDEAHKDEDSFNMTNIARGAASKIFEENSEETNDES